MAQDASSSANLVSSSSSSSSSSSPPALFSNTTATASASDSIFRAIGRQQQASQAFAVPASAIPSSSIQHELNSHHEDISSSSSSSSLQQPRVLSRPAALIQSPLTVSFWSQLWHAQIHLPEAHSISLAFGSGCRLPHGVCLFLYTSPDSVVPFKVELFQHRNYQTLNLLSF
jgi:hypothetical protein